MLRAILQRYESYDHLSGTDKATVHSYGPLYEEIMLPFKDTATNVLEIGVLTGASVAAWADYFRDAHVDGADIDVSRIRFGADHPRIRYHEVDCTLPDAPQRLGGKHYDVIVEDASHIPDHQVATAGIFAPYIKPGGMYVLEDILGDHAPYVRRGLEAVASKHGMQLDWHDLRANKGCLNDIVAVLRRPIIPES